MNRRHGVYFIGVVMVMMMPLTEGAIAQRHDDAFNLYQANDNQSAGITEQKAITIAKHHFKGRVLAINLSDRIYRIKMLSNQGTVHIILINATDGTIISTH